MWGSTRVLHYVRAATCVLQYVACVLQYVCVFNPQFHNAGNTFEGCMCVAACVLAVCVVAVRLVAVRVS